MSFAPRRTQGVVPQNWMKYLPTGDRLYIE